MGSSKLPNRLAFSEACGIFMCAALVATLVFSIGGCRVGPRDFENENDRLRRENLELRREIEQLSERLELRIGELNSLRQQLERADAEPMPDAEPPTLSQLAMGRYSGRVDTTGDGGDDLLRVYLRTLDQKGRVMPVAGRAAIQAVTIPDEGEPRLLARRVYEPQEFDRAWRSGFTGNHYTLELKLPAAEMPPAVSEVVARVSFTEARTGVKLRAQQVFHIHPPTKADHASNSSETENDGERNGGNGGN